MTVQEQETQAQSSTDRIEKQIVLRAPRSRVWRALSVLEEFGTWFRLNLSGEFAEGATVRGNVAQPGYEHLKVELQVERMEAERYFSYRWHPYPNDPAMDYSAEPTTLVEFILDEAEDGTAVSIIESGFDRIPLGRRAEAFRMNERGWTGQVKNLERYVS